MFAPFSLFITSSEIEWIVYIGKRKGTEHKQRFVCTGLFLFCMQGTVTHDIHVMLGPLVVIVFVPQSHYIHTYITNMYIYERCNSKIQPILTVIL